MKACVGSVLGAILCCSVSTVSSAGQGAMPPLLTKTEKKYAEGKSFVADFEQVNEIATTRTKKKSAGQIFFKIPGKLRWQTTSPNPSILVTDGKVYWFYTPPFDPSERGQVLIRKASRVGSQLANQLLGGQFSKSKLLKVEAKGLNRFSILPNPGAAGDVRRAEVKINPESFLIEEVFLEHQGGNTSRIQLSGVKLGATLEDEMFRFKAPEKTEEIYE